jgi:rubredoxin
MDKPACPACGNQNPRYLDASSGDAVVDYYRCEVCGCVFNVPKGRPDVPPHSVMGCVDDVPAK